VCERIEIVVIVADPHVSTRVRGGGDACIAPQSPEIEQRVIHRGKDRRVTQDFNLIFVIRELRMEKC